MKTLYKNFNDFKIQFFLLLLTLAISKGANAQLGCQAAFTPSGCANGTVQFWNMSTGTTSMTNYTWQFGDGGMAFTANTPHTYTANGIYNVCLTIKDSATSCLSTVCQTININCITTASCLASFNSYSCAAGTTWFNSTSTGTTSTTYYTWTFGDSGSSSLQNPSHTYTANGTYTVCLTIQDSISGCLSTSCKPVIINCVSTSIKKNSDQDAQIKVFPNPNNGIFGLEINIDGLNSKFINVNIYNVLGEEIYRSKEEIAGGDVTKTIDLTDVSSGAYFIRISTENNVFSKKVIVNK